MGDRSALLDRLEARLRLEHGLLAGFGLCLIGLAMIVYLVVEWASQGFGSLGEESAADLAATLVVIGMQVVFTSCLLSIIGLRRSHA
jgi:hypothetical protein